jgi:acyl transferase domain-containing protein
VVGVVFLFSSQGGQWPGMGRRLYASEPAFEASIARCDLEIARHLGWSLIAELTRTDAGYRLHDDNAYIQPALTAVQIALAELLRSRGVEPAAVAGLSMGEVAAAHLAGILDLAGAMRIVCCQAKLTGRPLQRAGRMGFFRLDAVRARALLVGLEDQVSLAVELGPESSVISGEAGEVERIVAEQRRRGVHAGMVPIGFAFHSPEVRDLEVEFAATLDGLAARAGALPMYSSVATAAASYGPAHWWKIMSEPASLTAMAARAFAAGYRTILELGPHPVLAESIEDIARASGVAVAVVPVMRRDGDERALLEACVRRVAGA